MRLQLSMGLMLGALTCSILSTGCIGAPSTSSAEGTMRGETAVGGDDAAIGFVVKAEGPVYLKRDGAGEYEVLDLDEPLFFGDLVFCPEESELVIECGDATRWTVPADGVPFGVANVCSPSDG